VRRMAQVHDLAERAVLVDVNEDNLGGQAVE
jgi:hypothetical protein